MPRYFWYRIARFFKRTHVTRNLALRLNRAGYR